MQVTISETQHSWGAVCAESQTQSYRIFKSIQIIDAVPLRKYWQAPRAVDFEPEPERMQQIAMYRLL